MKALKITAVLYSGFASSFEWSPSIDGIIAYEFMIEKLGIDAFNETHGVISKQSPVEGLPIAVEKHNGNWWYQCSRPIYNTFFQHTSYLHRRFNSREAEMFSNSKTTKVQTTKGAYKNARMAITKRIAPDVSWHVVGNKEECARLLSRVTHIGSQRRSGFGLVKEWILSSDGSEETARLFRALPYDFAVDNGVQGVVIECPIRPPSRHPDNIMKCVIPVLENAR